ncbi:unnamed protein product [Acanthoscelides obtectus]|uniref:Uncharacterized protein n=1 Tax=Acanthoscelides obtectus TaxID=200917 RepID=A0A9P0NVU0_ACAOB|nr:unnamed protein product [Acanthoscelides obtectus]CAK1671211.1 hypothetical protein AOBTE_LOCUS28148 [Acanthoscelides obtectus]
MFHNSQSISSIMEDATSSPVQTNHYANCLSPSSNAPSPLLQQQYRDYYQDDMLPAAHVIPQVAPKAHQEMWPGVPTPDSYDYRHYDGSR